MKIQKVLLSAVATCLIMGAPSIAMATGCGDGLIQNETFDGSLIVNGDACSIISSTIGGDIIVSNSPHVLLLATYRNEGRLGCRPSQSVLSCTPCRSYSIGLYPPPDSDQVALRHPKVTTYRCFLPDLTGFVGLRRAGPNPQRRTARQSQRAQSLEGEFGPSKAG